MADEETKPPMLSIAGVPFEIIKWIGGQGIATILLFAILYVLYTKAPEQLDKIQNGYEKIQLEERAERVKMLGEFRDALRTMETARKEDRDTAAKNFERVSMSIDKMTDLFKNILDRIDRPFSKPSTPPTVGGP